MFQYIAQRANKVPVSREMTNQVHQWIREGALMPNDCRIYVSWAPRTFYGVPQSAYDIEGIIDTYQTGLSVVVKYVFAAVSSDIVSERVFVRVQETTDDVLVVTIGCELGDDEALSYTIDRNGDVLLRLIRSTGSVVFGFI